MESAGQGLAPYIEAPPEPPVRRDDDELVEIRLDTLALEKLRLFWRRRNVFKFCLAVGLIAGVALSYIIPPHYESTVRLMPPENQGATQLAGLAGVLSGRPSDGLAFASSVVGMKSPGGIFVEVLHSRTLEDRMIKRFGLLAL